MNIADRVTRISLVTKLKRRVDDPIRKHGLMPTDKHCSTSLFGQLVDVVAVDTITSPIQVDEEMECSVKT